MIDKMRNVIKQIFRPDDGALNAMITASEHQASRTIAAADRLYDTVNEVLMLNDRITGRTRAKDNAKPRKN